MKHRVTCYLFAILLSLLGSVAAHAATVSFFLNQSNEDVFFPDGVNYLQVTILDDGTDVKFTVDILTPLTSIADSNFGIDKFYFNGPAGAVNVDLGSLSGTWTANDDRTGDGFGLFDVEVKTPQSMGGGIDRQTPTLMFTIAGVGGDVPSNYAVLSTGTAGEGNVFFAAHVAGFMNQDLIYEGEVTSAFFGGSAPVPLPAAFWLMGSGLVALGAFARRRRLRITARPPE